MKKQKVIEIPKLYLFLQKRSTIAALLLFICIIGLPLRMQNVKLDGYISDDAWWHYRHVKDVYELGHRLNPDAYEFTTLSRPMTYPPLFHYIVGYSYRLFDKFFSLFRFSHYFNIFEAIMYILLVYGFSLLITQDALFSLIGALASSLSYGFIIRARAGELMPFVPGDLFAYASILLLLYLAKAATQKFQVLAPEAKYKFGSILNFEFILLNSFAGILMGLSLLSWSGTVLLYLPLALFVFVALIIAHPKLFKVSLLLLVVYFVCAIAVSLSWYLPIILKYGINPHNKEMDWFMKNFTVLHQVKPLMMYILTSGLALFFVPFVFLSSLLRKGAIDKFIVLWIILTAIATYSGWRGYVAVAPVVSAVCISIGMSRMAVYFSKERLRYTTTSAIFILTFLLLGVIGYKMSARSLAPLNMNNPNEVRCNANSVKMLEYLKSKYHDAVTIDHVTWVSEDEALGSLKMVGGQYLEYLPKGSSEVFKDVSRIYWSDETGAYKICQKYNVDLIIVRKHFLQLPQLSILFAPPELKSDDYMRISRESEDLSQITINFTPKGMQTFLFRALNRHEIKGFEIVFGISEKDNPIPAIIVYKVKKDPPK